MSDNELKEVEFVVTDETEEAAVSAQPAADVQPAVNAQPVVSSAADGAGQGAAVPEGMPSKGAYTALLILGFICGILWGILSISPYSKMSKAIDAGNAAEAWENAKKVKILCLIGVAINVVMIMVRCGAGM